MAGERLADLAVKALALTLRNGIADQLDALETAQSLTAGTMVDVAEVVEANAPNDVRSPLIEVFDTSGECNDGRGGVWMFQLGVALSISGDADVVANERSLRRYVTAIISTIRAAPALGNSSIIAADVMTYTSEVFRGAASATRYVAMLTVNVHVDDT